MKQVLQLTAVIEREGDGYVATCPEVDVVSQGDTIEEARRNLLEAVEGFFEAASPCEIRCRLKRETHIMPIMPVASRAKRRRAMPKAMGDEDYMFHRSCGDDLLMHSAVTIMRPMVTRSEGQTDERD